MFLRACQRRGKENGHRHSTELTDHEHIATVVVAEPKSLHAETQGVASAPMTRKYGPSRRKKSSDKRNLKRRPPWLDRSVNGRQEGRSPVIPCPPSHEQENQGSSTQQTETAKESQAGLNFRVRCLHRKEVSASHVERIQFVTRAAVCPETCNEEHSQRRHAWPVASTG